MNRFEECIKSNAWKLDLSDEIENYAISLVDEMPRLKILDKSSRTISAAAIYISALLLGERRTQSELAEAFHTSEVSVRNRYKEMAEELDISRFDSRRIDRLE